VLEQVLNQGPTKLDHCDVDYSVLANGFRGNSPLKLFRALISPEVGNQEVFAIAALSEEQSSR
jgi:hypothetical protein